MLAQGIMLIQSQGEDVLFGLGYVSTFKRILFCYQVVEAASEGPRIGVLFKIGTFMNKFRGRVVNVARKIWSF